MMNNHDKYIDDNHHHQHKHIIIQHDWSWSWSPTGMSRPRGMISPSGRGILSSRGLVSPTRCEKNIVMMMRTMMMMILTITIMSIMIITTIIMMTLIFNEAFFSRGGLASSPLKRAAPGYGPRVPGMPPMKRPRMPYGWALSRAHLHFHHDNGSDDDAEYAPDEKVHNTHFDFWLKLRFCIFSGMGMGMGASPMGSTTGAVRNNFIIHF